MAAHWHALVTLPGKEPDRSPAMSWEKATRFKNRCRERWSRAGRIGADRSRALSVIGSSGAAWVQLVPCTDDRCTSW